MKYTYTCEIVPGFVPTSVYEGYLDKRYRFPYFDNLYRYPIWRVIGWHIGYLIASLIRSK